MRTGRPTVAIVLTGNHGGGQTVLRASSTGNSAATAAARASGLVPCRRGPWAGDARDTRTTPAEAL